MTKGMALLEERLGYTFTDRDLFAEALTHSSFAHEQSCPDNERLEFLGDAVLQVAISHALFSAFPKGNEGRLSRARAMLVNTQTLAMIAMDLGLDELLRLGKGEADSGGRTRPRSLAASTEALLGALYLDGGHAVADDAVGTWFATPSRRSLTAVMLATTRSKTHAVDCKRRPKPNREWLRRTESPAKTAQPMPPASVLMSTLVKTCSARLLEGPSARQ